MLGIILFSWRKEIVFDMPRKNYVPPEKRLRRYEDYGYRTHKDNLKKVKFIKFKIVVPTQKDKEQLQAAFEYLHNQWNIDTDFIAVNQVIHEYDQDDPRIPDNIIVDKSLYKQLTKNQNGN